MECVIRDMEGSLSAREAPSSRIPVILEGGSCTGTFFHEACGHQLETTELLRGGMFWDRRGEKIATEKVTLIDDGTMSSMYGSSRFDDEGMPRQKNVLIEKGILRSFLVDRLGGVRLNLPRSGSGRRQDYAHAPGARMSNTYLAPGTDDDDEIIRDTKEGLYVTALGGGTGGREFSLMATVAYWIKNGKIDHRVKGAMLLGRGDETMKKIDRVGKTFVTEENGGSFCGAESGFCATTTSGPRMRISEMVVGGKGGAL
jgi:TldD protein